MIVANEIVDEVVDEAGGGRGCRTTVETRGTAQTHVTCVTL